MFQTGSATQATLSAFANKLTMLKLRVIYRRQNHENGNKISYERSLYKQTANHNVTVFWTQKCYIFNVIEVIKK